MSAQPFKERNSFLNFLLVNQYFAAVLLSLCNLSSNKKLKTKVYESSKNLSTETNI